MRTVSLCALLALVAAKDISLESYTFEKFVEDFQVKFHPSETAARRTIFEKELQRVREHNGKNLSWKEGLNKFSAMTPSEKKVLFGVNKRTAKAQKKFLKNAKPLPADFQLKPVELLPRKVDWREDGIVSAVKDQGHCGSCWAFASTAVMESHIAKASGLLFDLSVEQVSPKSFWFH